MALKKTSEDTQSDPDDDASVPNTITTKADVEAEPSDCQVSLPDDNSHSPELKSPTESKHSCDADFSNESPEHVSEKVKRPRRKAQRARSALESSSHSRKHSSERALRSRPSLPPKPKLDSVINKDTGVSIIRPWSDQTICRTKQLLESDEIFVIGHEVMNRNISIQKPEPDKMPVDLPDLPPRPRCSAISGHSNLSPHRSKSNSSPHKTSQCKVTQGKEGEGKDKIACTRAEGKQNSESGRDAVGLLEDNLDPDFHNDVLEDVLRPYKRNAVSEERSVDSNKMSAKPKTSSQPSMKIHPALPVSSCSDTDSDLSMGEVFVVTKKSSKTKDGPEKRSKKKEKDKTKVKLRNRTNRSGRKQRPISAEFVKSNSFHSGSNQGGKTKQKIHSSPTLNANGSQGSNSVNSEKPKDIGFARVTKMLARAASERLSNDRVPSVQSVTNSQQSSVIGIDWLFGTDSDSTGRVFFV